VDLGLHAALRGELREEGLTEAKQGKGRLTAMAPAGIEPAFDA
jgi:hypothetical protein